MFRQPFSGGGQWRIEAVRAIQAISTTSVLTGEDSSQMRRYAGAHCRIYDLSWFLDGWWTQDGKLVKRGWKWQGSAAES